MLNIVIPMAGAGSRFAKEGYKDPKPLIPVHGIPMIKVVIDNLTPSVPHRFIFICQKQHISAYGLQEKLTTWAPNSIVIGIEGITEGAACTVLKAEKYIDNDNPLMIANSDQYVDINIDHYLAKIEASKLDGMIMTMRAHDPKWSFVALDTNGFASRVVEKEVISDEATVGIYNFTRGSAFISAANSMIKANERVNNEFYVAPTYNVLINLGQRFGVFNIGEDRDGMYGLGIPSDLEAFLKLPISTKALKGKT